MVSALVDYIPKLAPDINFLLLVSPNITKPLSEEKNVEHVHVKATANGPATMWWLPKVTDLSNVDLFHATYNIMPAGLKMPCITTIHDLMWLNQSKLCDDSWKRYFRKIFFKNGITRALEHSNTIATVSSATRESIIKVRPSIADKTFVTLSGVSKIFAPVEADDILITKLGLNPKNKIILTVGQYAPYKNHEAVIHSFAKACSMRTDIDLVLVQRQGPKAKKLLETAAKLGVKNRVFILRDLKIDELISLYSSASLLLHPSLCEGFGHPLVEAMACGCPVITSNQSAMPEVTDNAALLVDPKDTDKIAEAIGRVLDDNDLANSMIERGYARVEKLQWKQFAKENLNLYRQILNRNHSDECNCNAL